MVAALVRRVQYKADGQDNGAVGWHDGGNEDEGGEIGCTAENSKT